MQNITLYHYLHCPYCIRIRLMLGYLKIEYNSKVLPYSDTQTPEKLIGKKMLPILDIDQTKVVNESIDILELLDSQDQLKTSQLQDHKKLQDINQLLDRLGKDIYNLAMPYFIWSYEFSESDRKYFVEKKSIRRGPFELLFDNRYKIEHLLNQNLKLLEQEISTFYKSNNLSILDILIASHLWGMYVVPEFQFSNIIHKYLQSVKTLCQFNYHENYHSI